MNIQQLRDAIIPAIKTFCGVPIIEADQNANKPDYPFATFKFTSPYLKDAGQPEQLVDDNGDFAQLRHVDSFKVVISFTAYSMDADESFDLAQKIHDWFAFYGEEILDANNIAVVEQTAIQNRDTFIVDDYERRNGFDVTLRLTKELTKNIDWFENVQNITE